MLVRHSYYFVLVALIAACTTRPTSHDQTDGRQAPAPSQRAFLGLALSDRPDLGGALVRMVYPGPLNNGTDPLVNRGDILLKINGKPASRALLSEQIDISNPGDRMDLQVQRTAESNAAAPDSDDQIEQLAATLAARADWTGPVDEKQAESDRSVPARIVPVSDETTDLESLLELHLTQQDMREPVDKLIGMFRKWAERSYYTNMLSRVIYAFHYPTRLVELQRQITADLGELADDPRQVLNHAADNLDLVRPTLNDATDLSDPKTAHVQIARYIEEASALIDKAFAHIEPAARRALLDDARSLVEQSAQGEWIINQSEPQRSIRLMRRSMTVDFQALLDAMAVLSGLMIKSDGPCRDTSPVALPKALRDAVSGKVLAVAQVDGRWLVYGGAGENTYDMSRVDVVIDAAGNDTYTFAQPMTRGVQVIVDMDGDDQYRGEETGPAGAWLGVSLVVDYDGADQYEGAYISCGAAVMGVGILLDYDGADTFSGKYWSNGAAIYGAGALVDMGEESDVYRSEATSQGVGGPKGFGLLFDQGGNDLYRANGSAPSCYGNAAVYCSFSQGVGLGSRLYDTGGIGVIYDQSGSDRYEGGEFSQGGAYYWALGILHDRSGDDLYYGHRYSQGFGVHQACGILVDESGDDTYWAMTAASQGGAWDVGIGVLLDHAGNDAYRAGTLSQGAAAMQAIGWLIDLGGADRYTAPDGDVQGESGSNRYHYKKDDPVYSWSVLLDAGGAEDQYSRGRPNNRVISTGSFDESNPANSGLHGLFMDISDTLELWPTNR